MTKILHRLRAFPRHYPWTFAALLAIVVGLVLWGILIPAHGLIILAVTAIVIGVLIVGFIFVQIAQEWGW